MLNNSTDLTTQKTCNQNGLFLHQYFLQAMKLFTAKYISVVFLLTLFVFGGVASLSPLLNCLDDDQYELLVNKSGESKEKPLEDTKETKEFLSHFCNSFSLLAFRIGSNIHVERHAQFTPEVFLSITTPPPRVLEQV